MKIPDKHRIIIRFSSAAVIRTLAFAALIPEWNALRLGVFWVCLIGSSFLEPKPKQKTTSTLFDLRTLEGMITFAQLMAALAVLNNISDILPEGVFASVIHNPWNLFACWLFFMLAQLRSYLEVMKEYKQASNNASEATSEPAPSADSSLPQG